MRTSRRLEAWEQADRHTCKALLNCYIRENGAEAAHACSLNEGGGTFVVGFPASGAALSGRYRHSPIGEHEYGSFRASGGELRHDELARWIARELRQRDPQLTGEMEADFLAKVAGSCRNIALYLEHAEPERTYDYLASEQSLLLGHPFHPFPKSAAGFGEDDVRRFAPELRVRFPLCYMAVRRDAYREAWIEGGERIAPPGSAAERARRVLGERAAGYELLPMHPWQYAHVQKLDVIEAAIADGRLVPLGNCGPEACPTSSVRTVYVPAMRCHIKLPLDVQITNLRRNNTREQMRRTLDAADYVRRSGCFEREPHTQVAYEEGVCGCRLGDEDVESLLTVAYRPVRYDTDSTYVLASLAEAPAMGAPSRLGRVMDRRRLEDWFRRYLDISLLPLVRAAEERGIHFEAHLQNALLTVRDGMPHTFIIRDLEGVSVERDRAAPGADTSGPLFYTQEQARARTSYYFIVNHLGSFIHAIARDMESDELVLWSLAREALAREYESSGSDYARHLLTADAFAAKRNLASCLAGSGETPSYVPVANMMKRIGSGIDVASKQFV